MSTSTTKTRTRAAKTTRRSKSSRGLRIAPGADIKYGTFSLPDVEPEVRLRISIMVPSDVLARLREMAADEGIPYQTLANCILRDATVKGSITERLDRIERKLAR